MTPQRNEREKKKKKTRILKESFRSFRYILFVTIIMEIPIDMATTVCQHTSSSFLIFWTLNEKKSAYFFPYHRIEFLSVPVQIVLHIFEWPIFCGTIFQYFCVVLILLSSSFQCDSHKNVACVVYRFILHMLAKIVKFYLNFMRNEIQQWQ